MKMKQYRAALGELDMTQAEAAALFGLSPRQGRRYALDENPVPVPIAAHLRMMLRSKRMRRIVESYLRGER